MTYKEFGGTLSLTQSINQSVVGLQHEPVVWPAHRSRIISCCTLGLVSTGMDDDDDASLAVDQF